MPKPEKTDKPLLTFPKEFFWGAATSSHQVEGGTDNNWTDWEREHAVSLAQGSDKAFDTPSVHWYRIKEQALDPNNYISGRAVDHYRRYEHDFDIARQLNHNMHRFSLEWSRIEPQRGEYNKEALDHYRKVLQALHHRGITPMVTLFHFTLPKWVAAQGGWRNPLTLKAWKGYVEAVVGALGDEVMYWCTINEPEVFSSFSYGLGFWPPQEKNIIAAAVAYAGTMPRAHIAAYRIIKRHNPKAMVGAAKNNMWYVAQGKLVSPILARVWWWWANHLFLDQIKRHQDYIGLNYYFKFNFKHFSGDIDQQNPSEMGWGLHPEGMVALLKDLHRRFKKPIIITEFGLADSRDESRTWYIQEIIRYAHEAMTEGVDLRGILYWSLLDNFEWDKGFWPQFGLVSVSRKTMKRTIRQSARAYAAIIERGGLQ